MATKKEEYKPEEKDLPPVALRSLTLRDGSTALAGSEISGEKSYIDYLKKLGFVE